MSASSCPRVSPRLRRGISHGARSRVLRRLHLPTHAPEEVEDLLKSFSKCGSLNSYRESIILREYKCNGVVTECNRTRKREFAWEEFCLTQFARVACGGVLFNFTRFDAERFQMHPRCHPTARVVETFADNVLKLPRGDDFVDKL